ncbi:MAG: hypothetical protein SWX82_33660, partial [Cyanobacteriota bacterium]|nr:hypothetical protein [Cyanobacteriota bacterium]
MAHTDYGTDTRIGQGVGSGGVAHTDYGADTRIGQGVGSGRVAHTDYGTDTRIGQGVGSGSHGLWHGYTDRSGSGEWGSGS